MKFTGLLCSILIFWINGFTVGESVDPFSPCKSTNTSAGLSILCSQVSANVMKSIFTNVKSPYYFYKMFLLPSRNHSNFIAGIIGNHTVGLLTLCCPARKTNPLIVDPAALSNTKLVTQSLTIKNCNLNILNWSFLTGFSKLARLTILDSSNFHTTFYTLPTKTLTNLHYFELNSVIGLSGFENKSLIYPPPPPYGLDEFNIFFCYDVSDDVLDNILKNWVTPTSQETLAYIDLREAIITKIPTEFVRYNYLVAIEIHGNQKPLDIQSGAFQFPQIGPNIYFTNNDGLNSVSPGAFTGDFGYAIVSLYQNNLTTLDSCAFKKMLQQMNAGAGYLEVGNNPIDCSSKNICNLAWLVRDNPDFLNSAWSARCSNGTYFYDLNPKNLRGPTGALCP